MSRAAEIYPYKRQIEQELKNIGNDPVNSETLLKYYKSRVADGISLSRTCKCMNTLKIVSRMLGKPFEEATKDDITDLVVQIERRDIAGWTKRDYKVILKHFYKWLRGCEEGSPPEVRWIKTSTKVENKHPILPKDLLTPEEKELMVKSAKNPRDRALLEVFFEAGRRLGEILTLHIKDVEFDSLGAKLSVNGKIGEDFVRIISSAPSLATWLNHHPLRESPDAPVWVGLYKSNCMKQISYMSARLVLIRIAESAGVKKRIFYYLLRHTRIDETQGILTEGQQCMMFGWKFGSRMPSVYMKRYGKHIDNAQAIMNGVDQPQAKAVSTLRPKTCTLCKTENSPASKFCYKCGTLLEIKFGVEVEDRKASMEKMLYDIISSPERLEKLRTFLSETYKNS